MQTSYRLPVKTLLLFITLFLCTRIALAQSEYLPYSYQFDQKFDADIYSVNSSFHTTLKPFLIDNTIKPTYDKLMQLGVDTTHKSWVYRILFNQHLFDVKTKEYTFYGDYLPDLLIGRDIKGERNVNLNTRGYQVGGTVGDKFSFYSSGYENQGVFPAYYNAIINHYGFVPGGGYDKNFGATNSKDWSYATAIVSYTPIKQLNITLGEDKTFIGDGYRSLLLSDYAAPYPLLRLTANLGPVQYMAMWSYLEDLTAPKFDGFGSNRRKWGIFHYLDWNVTNRLSLGFFNAVIAAEADDNGNLHGFDVNYINPILLSGTLGPSTQIKDNTYGGFTGKYKIFDKAAIYGQLFLDLNNGYSSNTYGYQVGVRGADLFAVKNLNYLVEYNTVKPYTYLSTTPITSYTQYNQSLGDPLGSNFKELIGILNYSIGKIDLQGQLNYAKYYVNSAGENIGMLITPPLPAYGGMGLPGTGISTNLYYAEGTASYLVNPKYNLRLEIGGMFRDETNGTGNNKTMLLTFGLRSTFRNLYHDF